MNIVIPKKKDAPPPRRTYTVAPAAVQQARSLGLGGDVEARLRRMARRSAPITHAEGNKRFDDFVLLVQNNEVKTVHRL